MAFRRILVPTDFSKPAAKAVALARELASSSGAEITLLNVVPPMLIGVSPVEFAGAPRVIARLQADQEKFAKRKLDRAAAALRKRGAGTVRTVVRVGATHQVILAVAERLGAGLIVMGTHGRSGLSHLLIGSVAERVVRLARCPVLTIGSRARVRRQRARKRRRAE